MQKKYISILVLLLLVVVNQSCIIDVVDTTHIPSAFDNYPRTIIFEDLSSQESTGHAYSTVFAIGSDKLLAATGYFETFSDWSRGYLVSKSSNDGGKSWSEISTFQENIGKIYTSPASFIYTPDSTLLALMLVKETSDVCDVYQKESKDRGKTWTTPHKISLRTNVYQHFINGAATRLISGRIILPMCIGAYHTPPENNVFCYYSDDNGLSWKMSNKIEQPTHKLLEPTVAEFAKDSLLMTLRNQSGKMLFAKSYDGGMTWTKPMLSEITCPDAPSSISRIPNSKYLLLIWNNVDTSINVFQWNNRTPLTLAVSEDNGNKWVILDNIETYKNINFYYPSVSYNNNNAYITYTTRGVSDKKTSIAFKKIPISKIIEVYNKNKTKGSLLLLPNESIPEGKKP